MLQGEREGGRNGGREVGREGGREGGRVGGGKGRIADLVMPIVSAKFVVRREMKPRFFPCPLVTEALIELIFAAVLRSSPPPAFLWFPRQLSGGSN